MLDLREVQRAVMDNKRRQGFNLTDVPLELCLLHGEVAELFDAWRKRTDTIGEELADVALYVCGLAGILGIGLADEVERKLEVNARRRYERRADGVLVRVEDGDPQRGRERGVTWPRAGWSRRVRW